MPLAVKFGIDFFVSFVATAIYIWFNIEERLLEENVDMNVLIDAFANEIQQYTVVITAVSSLILLPILIRMFRQDAFKDDKCRMKWQMYPALVLVGITASVGMNNLMTLSQISRVSIAYQNVAALFYQPSLLTQIIGLGLIVPIVEELLFRGVIFRRLRREFGRKAAVGISALIFGLIHGNLVQFIYAFILGALFAYLYELLGIIWVPICLHITANLVAIMKTEHEILTWMFSSFFRVGVITVGCAFVCSALVVMLKNKCYENVKKSCKK